MLDDSLVDHLAEAGFRPEFGARELRRLIRSELETQLARAMLGNELHEGERVEARWDKDQQKVVLTPQGRSDTAVATGAAQQDHQNAVEVHRAEAQGDTGKGTSAAAE